MNIENMPHNNIVGLGILVQLIQWDFDIAEFHTSQLVSIQCM
jgi:hypothetical protein